MQPEDIAFVLVLVLVLGAGVFFAWERHTMCVAFIEGDLRRHHATNIHASFDWFDWDRDTYTYDVRWMDTEGKWRNGRCKVRAHEPGRFGEDVVYWMAGKPGRQVT